jgi:asparagine synthase (glutamine-hydrolysing)
MCGIAGYFAYEGGRTPERVDVILRMVRALATRGPDDEGLALFGDTPGRALALRTSETATDVPLRGPVAGSDTRFPHRVAFGHRRFSIVDPTPRGHQPFFSSDGDVCVIFNGEIYNYVELRDELQAGGREFRTECDTEVVVQGYQQWGTDCFARFIGFWAIALYDGCRSQVLLARDRIGKAPLYVARHHGTLYWASEIKSLRAATQRDEFEVRSQAISDFVAGGYRDLNDQTFYEGIETFPRAAWAWLGRDGGFSAERYWELPRTRTRERDLGPGEAAHGLRERLADSLRLRLRADVPIGIHLSGGTDSSALVGLAASAGHRLRAYTVSYPGTASDEEPYARQVADRWSGLVEYNVITPAETDFFDNADWYLPVMDEPFHSPSMLTARLVWREMAAQGLRVSIDGGAADELLCGYASQYYPPFLTWLLERGRLLRLHREAVALSELPARPLSSLYLQRWSGAAKRSVRRRFPKSAVESPQSMALLVGLPPPTFRPPATLEGLLLENATDWLMNYWLRSGHQNFMSVPLEVRSPFLDHRVIEYCFRLPVTYLIRDGWLKWVLREAARDELPEAVAFRPRKMGFPFPLEAWLRANEKRFFRAIGTSRCPYIDIRALADGYAALVRSEPLMLWRAMCVCLWWRRCVINEPLCA